MAYKARSRYKNLKSEPANYTHSKVCLKGKVLKNSGLSLETGTTTQSKTIRKMYLSNHMESICTQDVVLGVYTEHLL